MREQAELLYAEYGLVDDILTTVQEARAQDRPWEEIEERFEAGKERASRPPRQSSTSTVARES